MKLPTRDLRRAWKLTELARSKDDPSRPVLAAMCMEMHPAGVRLVATDSYLLLTTTVGDAPDDPDDPMVVGDPVLCSDVGGVVVPFLGEVGSETEITVEEHTVTFTSGRAVLTVPRVAGKFPDWRALMAKKLDPPTKPATFGPLVAGRLAALTEHDGLWITFSAEGMSRFHLGPPGAVPKVHGLVMVSVL